MDVEDKDIDIYKFFIENQDIYDYFDSKGILGTASEEFDMTMSDCFAALGNSLNMDVDIVAEEAMQFITEVNVGDINQDILTAYDFAPFKNVKSINFEYGAPDVSKEAFTMTPSLQTVRNDDKDNEKNIKRAIDFANEQLNYSIEYIG